MVTSVKYLNNSWRIITTVLADLWTQDFKSAGLPMYSLTSSNGRRCWFIIAENV